LFISCEVAVIRAFLFAIALIAPLINAASLAAQSLPRSTPESQGVSSKAVLGFIEALDQIDQMHSAMLVRHGRVVAEGWWSPYAADDPHMLYSLSKSFASTAVGLAIAEGKLSLDDSVASFFPEDVPTEPSDNLKSMRVRDLLAMNTGQHGEDVGGFRFDGPQPLTKAFLAMPVAHKPGTHFFYNTPATYMCSAIVQKVSGEKLIDYLRPRLFEPLGIANPTWEESADGVSFGGFGLNVTTEDIAKFGELYLRRGKWNGKQLIPAEWIEMATARQVSNGSSPASDWEQGYGFQFWRCRHGAYRGDGAFGQYCIVMPQQDAVLAITSGVTDMQAVLNVVWDKLLPALNQGNDALPADVETAEQLKKRLAALQVPTPSGDRDSSVGAEVSGAFFEFPANDVQLESVRLDATGDEVVLTMRAAGKEYRIPCGFGQWPRDAVAPRLGDPRSNGAESRVAAAGAWTAGNRYQAKLCMVETPYQLTLSLVFDGDQLTLDGRYNVSFGDPKWPQLVGRRKRP
jgi:CubicO group peptidase (beta-lactamase class C family)